MCINNIFLPAETKVGLGPFLDSSQFHAAGYQMFGQDRDESGGGLLACVRSDIPVRLIQPSGTKNNE